MKARSLVSLSVTTVLALGAAGCGSESDEADAAVPATSTIEGVTVTGEFEEEPVIEVDGLTVDEPTDAVLIAGDGEEVASDDTVNYHFRMILADGGEEVSSSYAESTPLQMDLAQQPGVIADSVVGATISSRIVIAMTAKDLLGSGQATQYGMRGKDELVMVLDLVSVAGEPLDGPDGEAVTPDADAPTVVEQDRAVTGIDFAEAPAKPSDELQVIPLIEGTGDEVAEGDSVTVDYFGTLYGDGEPFDESYSTEPVTFSLTEGSLIEGWVNGLAGVTAGSRVMLVVPPDQGYGDQASGDIPAGSTLVFVIDVLGVNL